MSKKYVTTNKFTGRSYNEVAIIMTKEGDKMNHSSVRNHVTNGFIKIVKNISKKYDVKYSEEEVKKIAQSIEFQESIVEIMKRG